jgi:hypothetical protein
LLGKWRAVLIPALLAGVIYAWAAVPETPTFEGTRVERFTQALYYYKGTMEYPYDITVRVAPKHDAWCAWVTATGAASAEVGFVDPPAKSCTSMKPEFWALHEACHMRMLHIDAALQMSPDEKEREVKRCMIWYGERRRSR